MAPNAGEIQVLLRLRDLASRSLNRFAKVGKGAAEQVRKGLTDTEKQSRRTQRAMQRLGRATNSLRARFTGLRTVLGGLVLGFSAFLAIRGSISLIAEFGEQMEFVRNVTAATGEQFDILTEKARTLGATTRFTASQAAEAMLQLARAGFSVDETLAAVSSTLDLATAGGISLAEAADVTSSAIRQFQLVAEAAPRVVDDIVTVANAANTTVLQLGEAFKFAGPIASAFGLSVEETAASIGVLGDSGLKATLAGTNLRGILVRLVKPADGADEVLADLGLTLRDLSPLTNDYISILRKLSDANINAEQAAKLFLNRQAGGAVILTRNVDRLEELVKLQEESRGAAQELAENVEGTLKGSFLELRSAIQDATLEVGERGFTGALQGLVDSLTGAIRLLTGTEKDMRLVSTATLRMANAIELAGQAMVLFISVRIIAFLTSIARGIGTVISSLIIFIANMRTATAATLGFRAALVGTGIGAIVVALGTAAAAMTVFETNTEFATEDVRELVTVGRELKNTADDLERIRFDFRRAIEAGEGRDAIRQLQKELESLRTEFGNLQREIESERAPATLPLEAVVDVAGDRVPIDSLREIAQKALERQLENFEPVNVPLNLDPRTLTEQEQVAGAIVHLRQALTTSLERLSTASTVEEIVELTQATITSEEALRIYQKAIEDVEGHLVDFAREGDLAPTFDPLTARQARDDIQSTIDDIRFANQLIEDGFDDTERRIRTTLRARRLQLEEAVVPEADIKRLLGDLESEIRTNQQLEASIEDVTEARKRERAEREKAIAERRKAVKAFTDVFVGLDAENARLKEQLRLLKLSDEERAAEVAARDAQRAAVAADIETREREIDAARAVARENERLREAIRRLTEERQRGASVRDEADAALNALRDQTEALRLQLALTRTRSREERISLQIAAERKKLLEAGVPPSQAEPALADRAAALRAAEPAGFSEGFNDALAEFLDFQRQAAIIGQNTVLGLRDTFQRGLFDFMTRGFEDMGQVAEDFARSLLDLAASIASEFAISAIFNQLAEALNITLPTVQVQTQFTGTATLMGSIWIESAQATGLILNIAATSVADQIVGAAAAAALILGVGGGGPGGGGRAQSGAVISGGRRIVPFQAGGVVDTPTTFPMSGGRRGLMGEAGPEAILPLTQTAEGLGVSAEGIRGDTFIDQRNVEVHVSIGGVQGGGGPEDLRRQIEPIVRTAVEKAMRKDGKFRREVQRTSRGRS